MQLEDFVQDKHESKEIDVSKLAECLMKLAGLLTSKQSEKNNLYEKYLEMQRNESKS